MAREHNIDLRLVKGTGAGGRITKQDVEAYLAAQAARRCRRRPAPARRRPGRPAAPGARSRVEPMSIMRQKIAEHMVMSKRTSAHVTTVHQVDMTQGGQAARERTRTSSRRVTASR